MRRPGLDNFGRRTMFEWLVLGVICSIALLMCGSLLIKLGPGFVSDYSEGERTGVIYKISKRGVIFKTWEGEMNLGGMAADSNGAMTLNKWRFSVENDDVAKSLGKWAASGNKVTVKYHQFLVGSISKGETDYFVTGTTTVQP